MLDEIPPAEIKPQPLVRGDDLIAQGYAPGPQFKEILKTLEDAQLEGSIHTHAEALKLISELFPRSPS